MYITNNIQHNPDPNKRNHSPLSTPSFDNLAYQRLPTEATPRPPSQQYAVRCPTTAAAIIAVHVPSAATAAGASTAVCLHDHATTSAASDDVTSDGTTTAAPTPTTPTNQ